MTVQNIEKLVLKLDLNSRAKLAAVLLSSLDDISEEENEKLWAKEALRRHEEMTSRKVKGIPANTVFKNIRDRYK